MTELESRSAVDVCADRLREMIADGDLHAGQALRQDELAARLGMSRTPIREAVGRLQSEGLVVIERHRGATVANPSPELLLEIYEVRLLLEPHASALAARVANAAQLGALQDLYEQMESCPAWEFYRLNRAFHLAVYEIAEHATLYEHIRSLRYRSDPYVRLLIGAGGGEHAQRGHHDLLRALEAHDESAAVAATTEHLTATMDTVASLLQARRGPEQLRAETDGDSARIRPSAAAR